MLVTPIADSSELSWPRHSYSCNKELFGVIFSHYSLYNSPHLALMALTQDMIQDLDSSMTKDRERVFTTRRCRESISRAWEADRRHVEAIEDSQSGILIRTRIPTLVPRPAPTRMSIALVGLCRPET